MIDIDDPTTWPSEVRGLADRYASEVMSWSEFSLDGSATDLGRFDLSGTMELDFRQTIGRQPVMMYHASRLMEHEVAAVKAHGLIPLDADLRADRIRQASSAVPGGLSDSEVALLTTSGPLHCDHPHTVRVAQAWFVTRTVLTDSGLDEIFGRWGGEAISWAAHGLDDDARRCETILEQLSASSKPAVVVLEVDPQRIVGWKSLWPPFVGRLLSAGKTDGEWLVDDGLPIPVANVHTPDHCEWDERWSERRRFS